MQILDKGVKYVNNRHQMDVIESMPLVFLLCFYFMGVYKPSSAITGLLPSTRYLPFE